MLLKASIPVEKGSEAYQSGAMQRTFQAAAEALKPEAMYFFPEDGKRTCFLVFEMEGSWQLPDDRRADVPRARRIRSRDARDDRRGS